MDDAQNEQQTLVCIVGLGYVGLPLAVALAKHYAVIGFDVNQERIAALQNGIDKTKAVETTQLQRAQIKFTTSAQDIANAAYIIVAVPTPIDAAKRPDLSYIKSASKTVGKHLKKGATVIYESTVYPGVTQDICLPILEAESGMRVGDFALGYSPERINPGDKTHQLQNTIKIIAAHTPQMLPQIRELYKKIVDADLHEAPSIKVAEAAKIVENVQRDMNIALMNELALIFNKLNIDTEEVLEAAGTKWNFHKYYPGLVGGHCIGVDPYYLAFQAIEHGYHPKIILSGREVNDYMARHVAEMTIKELTAKGKILKECRVALLGVTFKEDVTDLRNTRAKNVIQYLKEYGIEVHVVEPNVSKEAIAEECNVQAYDFNELLPCDAVVVVNKHTAFKQITLEHIKAKLRTPIVIDTKGFFEKAQVQASGITYRRL